MTWFLRQATASQEVPLGPFLDSTDGNTEETALSIANTDIKLFKTGATTLASKNSGGATHIAAGEYYCVLDATDTDTIGPLMIRVHVAGALAVRVFCVVLDEAVYDSLFGTVALSTLAGTAQTGDSYALANGANGFVALKGDTAAILTDTGTTLDARIPAALVGGRMDSSTGAMAANVLTAAATAADFTTEIQAGLATAASIAALNNLSAAQVNTEADTAISDAALASAANLAAVAGYLDTEMAAALAAIVAVKAVTDLLPNAGALTNLDAAISTRATPAQILTTALTESYAADGAVPTLTQAMLEILAWLTEKSVTGVTVTTRRRDGSTTARTYTLNDATTPTSITGA